MTHYGKAKNNERENTYIVHVAQSGDVAAVIGLTEVSKIEPKSATLPSRFWTPVALRLFGRDGQCSETIPRVPRVVWPHGASNDGTEAIRMPKRSLYWARRIRAVRTAASLDPVRRRSDRCAM